MSVPLGRRKRLPKRELDLEEHQAALTFNSLDSRATLKIVSVLMVCISFLVLLSLAPTVVCGSVTFDQSGIGNFSGVVLQVDGSDVQLSSLPKIESGWGTGSNHSFSWLSPLTVSMDRQYVWTSTTGLSTAQSGTVTTPGGGGSITGNYKTQYYVTVTFGVGGTVNSASGFYDVSVATSISATPNTGYAFTSWVTTGSVSVSDNSSATTTMIVSGVGSVEATYELLQNQYQVTFNGSIGGSTNPAPGSYWYDIGSTIPISASPNLNFEFSRWSVTGDLSVADQFSAVTTLTVGGSGSVEPIFRAYEPIDFYLVGVGTDASGTVLTMNGTSYARDSFNFTMSFLEGTDHTFSWSSPISPSTNSRYVWISTSGLSTAQSGSITIPSGPGSLTGNYMAQYYITITSGERGAVNTPSDWYYASSTVPITANPSSGYAFNGWITTGGIAISDPGSPTTAMTISGAGSVEATFELLPIGVHFRQSGIGTDFSGAVVDVDGAPIQLWEFMKTYSWGMGSNHTFSWLSPLTVSAEKRYIWVSTFGLSNLQSGTVAVQSEFGEVMGTYVAEYFVAVQPTASGTVDPMAGGWYRVAQEVPILAMPLANYQFSNWTTTGNVTVANSTASSTAFTVGGAGTIRANFIYVPSNVTVTFQALTGGSISPSGSRSYQEGTSLGINASPSLGYHFLGWEVVGNATVSSSTSAVTTLFVNGPATVTANFRPIDYDPPNVTDITPANESLVASGYVTISASLSDETGVDTSSIVLKVDGIVVSGAQVSSGSITYTAPLQPGTHTVELTVEDIDGNPRTVAWSITVAPPPAGYTAELLAGIVFLIIFTIILIFYWDVKRKPVVTPAKPGKREVVR